MTQCVRHRAVTAAMLLLTTAAACTGPGRAPERDRPHQDSAPRATARGASPQRAFTLVTSGELPPRGTAVRGPGTGAGGESHDARQLLARLRPVVSAADLAICQLATVLGPVRSSPAASRRLAPPPPALSSVADAPRRLLPPPWIRRHQTPLLLPRWNSVQDLGGARSGSRVDTAPTGLAAELRDAGFDACSTASGHTLDDGSAGVRRTLDALDEAGIRHTGSARAAAEAVRPALLTAGGARVAQLAYTYGTEGVPFPDGQPWAVNLIDEGRIIADARAARAAGADIVVVSLDRATRRQTTPDAGAPGLGRALTAARTGGRPDIDLILGAYAHAPQGYEKLNGTWVVHGSGVRPAGASLRHPGDEDPRAARGSVGRFTFAPPAKKGGRWTVRKAEFLPR